jgi:hypothetical protein
MRLSEVKVRPLDCCNMILQEIRIGNFQSFNNSKIIRRCCVHLAGMRQCSARKMCELQIPRGKTLFAEERQTRERSNRVTVLTTT